MQSAGVLVHPLDVHGHASVSPTRHAMANRFLMTAEHCCAAPLRVFRRSSGSFVSVVSTGESSIGAVTSGRPFLGTRHRLIGGSHAPAAEPQTPRGGPRAGRRSSWTEERLLPGPRNGSSLDRGTNPPGPRNGASLDRGTTPPGPGNDSSVNRGTAPPWTEERVLPGLRNVSSLNRGTALEHMRAASPSKRLIVRQRSDWHGTIAEITCC